MEQLEKLFTDIFSGAELVRAIFSGKRRKSSSCSRAVIRPVMLSGNLSFQAEYTEGPKSSTAI